MSEDRRDPYRGAPPGLTEEERRAWWERQRRKFVWGPGDAKTIKKGGNKGPKGDGGGASPGR